jgi:hypothetical protein
LKIPISKAVIIGFFYEKRLTGFLPAKKDGKPIASRALLSVRFQLERN